MVLFGSFRELHYRLEIIPTPRPAVFLLISSGPGFELEILRAENAEGVRFVPDHPAAAGRWLSESDSRARLAELVSTHFHRLVVLPDRMRAECFSGQDDLFPEAPVLAYYLSVLAELWQKVPPEQRRGMPRAEFLEPAGRDAGRQPPPGS